jgi:hypothetical protein
LLAEPGALFDLLLGEAPFPPDAGEVLPDEFAHIHAQTQ